MINSVRAITDAPMKTERQVSSQGGKLKLYLKITETGSQQERKTRAILQMFPGKTPVVLYFADTGARESAFCDIREPMLRELKRVLGEPCVVVK